MKKFLSVLVVLLTLCVVQMRAKGENDKVVIQSATIAAGQEFTLPIELVNELDYVGFQMDIVLPEGISFVLNKKGKVAPEGTDRLDETHSLSCNLIDEHSVRIICTSMDNETFYENSGTLISVNLKADENLQPGAYEIKVMNIIFPEDDGNNNKIKHNFADATATFTIPSIHTYKFMNGEETIASGEKMPGEEITAPENPTKTGYAFKGWNPSFTGTMPDADVTYQAVWEANPYKMTFILDNGSENIEKTLAFGSDFEAPEDPTKIGYTFSGWDPALPTTVPAEDKTFTAKWTINKYTMTFVLDEGKESAVTQDYNSELTAPEPTKTGFTFVGWNPEVPPTIPAENKTFTAQWERAKFKLTFIVDGQETDSLMLFEDPIVAPETPVKEGYTFKGWGAEIPATMPAEALTFTAVFEINKYWVTFMAEETEVSKIQMEYNADIVVPTAPEFEGKRFIKWTPEVAAKVPAHDVTYEAIYALIVRDTIYVDVEVHDTTYIDVEVHDTIVVYDTIRVSTLQRVDAPFINVTADGKIELTCEQKDAVIYYTIDGTDPTEASKLYSEPFTVADKTVIKAIAVLRSEVSQFQLQTGMKNARMDAGAGKSYNLQGRQVSKASRGVFIQDGKKVIKK